MYIFPLRLCASARNFPRFTRAVKTIGVLSSSCTNKTKHNYRKNSNLADWAAKDGQASANRNEIMLKCKHRKPRHKQDCSDCKNQICVTQAKQGCSRHHQSLSLGGNGAFLIRAFFSASCSSLRS